MKRLFPSTLKTFLQANPNCLKADLFEIALPLDQRAVYTEDAPGILLGGPYPAFVSNESGYLDPDTNTLYWIDSDEDAGDVYQKCMADGHCGTSVSEIVTYDSFRVNINVLDRDLGLTQINTDPLPCSYNATPNGLLLVYPGTGLYIGAYSGYAQFRWFFVAEDGTFSPCQATNVWGKLTVIIDDGWGGGAVIGYPVAAALTFDFVHVNASGEVYVGFGSSSPAHTLASTAITSGAGATDSTSLWVLSADSVNGYCLDQVATGGVSNFPLSALTPTPSGAANAVEYCAADNTLLFWIGDTLYKWDCTTHAQVSSASVPYKIAGPIAGGLIPNGLDLYDASTLTRTYHLGTVPGLPAFTSGKIFRHWYNPTDSVLWLQANDGKVYGVCFGSGPFVPGTLYTTEGQWDITVPEGANGWAGAATTFSARRFGVWSRGAITSQADFSLAANTMSLVLIPQQDTGYPGTALGIVNAAHNHLFDGAEVVVYTVYMPFGHYGDVSAGVEVKFRGTITRVPKLGRNRVEFECADPLYLLNQRVPTRLFQSNCPWRFCDENCGLNKADFTFPFIADGTSTQEVLVPTVAFTQPDNYFTQGVVTCKRGANTGLSQTVDINVSGSLTMRAPWLFPVTAGDTFVVVAGCDKTLATCTAFGNEIHFGGTPFVPTPAVAY